MPRRETVRHLFRVRLIQCFAEFAAVDFRFLADFASTFRVIVPSLQMPGAELSLGVLFVAGTLLRFAHFDLHFRRRGLDGRGSGRSRGWRSGGCRALRCCFLSLLLFPSRLVSDYRVSYSNPSCRAKHDSSAGRQAVYCFAAELASAWVNGSADFSYSTSAMHSP